MVERTFKSLKGYIRANIEDGLPFNQSVIEAIKAIRMSTTQTTKQTPFQLHYGRKPRNAITNMTNTGTCLLSDWKKTLNKYVSAQPDVLQTYTVHDGEGKLADYMIIDTYRKRRASVSNENFTPYTFAEKKNQRDALKNPFETKNLQTAIAETEHTVTTDKNRVLHKKLISGPIEFQPQKKKSNDEEAATRQGWNKCRQSGKLCRCCDCEAC